MTSTFFDTLKYSNKLKSMGMDQKLAETQIEVMSELGSNIATQLNDNWSSKQPASQKQIDELKLENEKLRTEILKVQAEAKTNLLKWCVFMLIIQVVLAIFYVVGE